ncbi:MAG: hypothetical protein HY826_13875 [Actinobacteria bacterium]|nr:hypothetical protein [Actinomycetota bacterium]
MNQRRHRHQLDQHDLGLRYDLPLLTSLSRPGLSRRNALRVIGGASVLALAACAGKSDTAASTTADTTAGTDATIADNTTAGATTDSQPATGTIPNETAGPFPGDGSNGPDVLSQSGVVRRDITTSLGSSATAPGIPLTVTLKITDGVNGPPIPGAAVYLWHCDQQGRYSMYSQGVANETFLRGVQEADANGELTFVTIYPGCYSGRWPHMHFELFDSLEPAAPKLAISQLAMTEASATQAFATAGYEASVANFAGMTLAGDMVFADGAGLQTPTTTGDISNGFAATLTVAV